MSELREKLFKFYEKEGEVPHQEMMYQDTDRQLLMKIHKEFLCGLLTKQTFVLDIGCSDGWFTTWLAKYAKVTIGLDISVRKLRRAVNESKDPKPSYVFADWDQMHSSIGCSMSLCSQKVQSTRLMIIIP